MLTVQTVISCSISWISSVIINLNVFTVISILNTGFEFFIVKNSTLCFLCFPNIRRIDKDGHTTIIFCTAFHKSIMPINHWRCKQKRPFRVFFVLGRFQNWMSDAESSWIFYEWASWPVSKIFRVTTKSIVDFKILPSEVGERTVSLSHLVRILFLLDCITFFFGG